MRNYFKKKFKKVNINYRILEIYYKIKLLLIKEDEPSVVTKYGSKLQGIKRQIS